MIVRRLVPAASAALLGALSAVVLLVLSCALSPALRLDFDVDPPRLVTGMHPAERDEATGLTFAWTSRDAAIRLPGLDRRIPWRVDITLRGGRQVAADNPHVSFFVDGIQVADRQSRTEFDRVSFVLPPRPERPRGALIALQSSATFVPGPGDPRALGVLVDAIAIEPDGLALPPRQALEGVAMAGAALGAAIGLIGVVSGLAVGGAFVLAAGAAAIVARNLGPYTALPDVVQRIALVTAVALVAGVALAEVLRGQHLRNTARFAAVFTAGTFFFKLALMSHPDMPLGDALFQAHRFQEVLRGNYYFTSIAPGNYQFPYAPGLYLAALPFADLVRRELGDVALLRTVVVAADALAGLALYAVVARAWDDRRAAAFATAVYQLLPLDFLVYAGGTLTNAFAQSLAVLALAAFAAPDLRRERQVALPMFTAICLAAFVSHTSTFAILAVTFTLVAAAFFLRGGVPLRSRAWTVAGAGALALVLAVALYYAHFLDTYRTELSRIGQETATAAADAGGRTIGDRARIVPYYLQEYYGVPALVLAAIGSAMLWRSGARDRVTLAVAGLGAACALFLAVGVVTPVDMRYYVAALPAIAVVSAAAASAWWERGDWRRFALAALLAGIAWRGVATWWSYLR